MRGVGLVGVTERAQLAGGRPAHGVEGDECVVRADLPWSSRRERRRAPTAEWPVVRVVLVDDDPLVRAGLRMILGAAPAIRVVAEARRRRAGARRRRRARRPTWC